MHSSPSSMSSREIFSYEALIRGRLNEPAFRVPERVPASARYQFDEDTLVAAIALAVPLELNCHLNLLNLNFLPQGLYTSDASVTSTLAAAARHTLPIDRVILEATEGEVIADCAHLGRQLSQFRSMGLNVAIDEFGAGYSGLNMLADFQPEQIKIDMNLVRDMSGRSPLARQLGDGHLPPGSAIRASKPGHRSCTRQSSPGARTCGLHLIRITLDRSSSKRRASLTLHDKHLA
jgi:EAL domain-containing protein (putative c-di-GMP-specific phosphodiesterase class I)